MPLNWNLSDIYLIIIVGLYVFMWMATEIKYHSHHITSRVYIFNMTYHCCCELWSRGLRWYLTDYCTIFFSFIFISWRLITLQYWSGFCYTLTWVSHGFTCAPHPNPPFPPPSPSHPSGSSQCTSSEHLSHASNLGWWSVSPLIVYLFQCYFLRTSHPCLLPQSLKVCSVHLCLFFCFAYRVIITIFLNSIYLC